MLFLYGDLASCWQVTRVNIAASASIANVQPHHARKTHLARRPLTLLLNW